MKIAVLTGSFLPKVGGAQVFSHNISRQLAASGHVVDVYVPSDQFHALSPPYRELLTPLPWKLYGTVRRLNGLGLYRAARYLRGRQRREGYDVWLVVATYPSGYAATTLREYVPVVLRASGEDIQADIARLQDVWHGIETRVETASAPALLYEEPPLVTRVIREHFTRDFKRLLIDQKATYDRVLEYLRGTESDLLENVLYELRLKFMGKSKATKL